MPRALRSSVAHSRAVSGRARDAGDRLTVRSTAPSSVASHASTRWPTGAVRGPGAYSAHPGQTPPHQATRAASPRSRDCDGERSSRDPLMWQRAGGGTSGGIGLRSSRSVSAEMPDLLRRGWDSNPRRPEGRSGFQDRRIRPLCHPSNKKTGISVRSRPPAYGSVRTRPRDWHYGLALARHSTVRHARPKTRAVSALRSSHRFISVDRRSTRKTDRSLGAKPSEPQN